VAVLPFGKLSEDNPESRRLLQSGFIGISFSFERIWYLCMGIITLTVVSVCK